MQQTTALLPAPSLDLLRQQAQWMALLMLAVTLHVIEASLPSLGPWLKPGLANVVTLIALVLLGPRRAFALAVARVFAGAMIIGTLFTPTFMLSLSGALAAAVVMFAAWRLIPGISPIGVSLLGALAHMLAQFVTVEALFIRQPALYYLLPPLLLASCATGWINGILATYAIRRLKADGHG